MYADVLQRTARLQWVNIPRLTGAFHPDQCQFPVLQITDDHTQSILGVEEVMPLQPSSRQVVAQLACPFLLRCPQHQPAVVRHREQRHPRLMQVNRPAVLPVDLVMTCGRDTGHMPQGGQGVEFGGSEL